MLLACWAIWMFGVAISFYFHSRFLKRLKSSHASLYADLGEPRLFTKYPVSTRLIVRDVSPKNSLTKYTEFMAKRQWRELRDSELNRYANCKDYTQYSLLAVFFVAVISIGVKP